MISWLHVSDIHLNKLGTETKRMRSQLIPFLKNEKINSEYLFVTGDLRYAPNGTFDKDTVKFLKELQEAVHVSNENVFIVPGNHDVNRDTSGRDEAIQLNLIADKFDSKNGEIDGEVLKVLKSSQQDYISVLEDFYKDVPERINEYKQILYPHFVITTDDFNIVHIDSTLSYTERHERDLVIGTSMLIDVLNRIDKDKPTIILSHYSFDFLSRSEQREIHKLMMDYNVRMWLAGHEHNSLLREQWDYFYEFQSGNLFYEGEESKSCFLVGKYDEDSRKGHIVGFKWDSEGGWIKDPCIANKGDRSIYKFDLSEEELVSAVFRSEPERNSNNRLGEPFTYEKYCDEDKNITEVKHEIYSIKLTVYPWNQKSGLSLLLGEGLCSEYAGWIYLDKSISPFLKVNVKQTHYEGFDEYFLSCDTLQITIAKDHNIIIDISVGYNLSHFSDVDSRLYHLGKIKEYINSKSVFVKMIGHEVNNLSFDTVLKTKEWNETITLTNYWIDQMERIAKIEQYYEVKFYLPVKSTDEEYLAISVLSDSIDGKSCRTLLPITMKNPGFMKTHELREKMPIGNVDRLLPLSLFGYVFKPVRQYILPGKYVWKKSRGWSEKISGTVQIGVDFEISYEDDKNKELIRSIPYEKYKYEFDLDEIPELEGEMDKFFREYISMTYDIQRNRQLFLNYRDVLNIVVEADGSLPSGSNLKKKIKNKITVNRLTDNLVSSGNKLVTSLDKTIFDLLDEKDYSIALGNDNLGYLWMCLMNLYSAEGRFPVSLDTKNGEAYFDLKVINMETDYGYNLSELTRAFEEYKNYADSGKLPYYDMLRNYTYTLAKIYREYYERLDDIVRNYADTMSEIIKNNPILIHNGKVFSDVVAYTLASDEGNLHIFDNNADIMLAWNRYKQEAGFFFEWQNIGVMGEVFL